MAGEGELIAGRYRLVSRVGRGAMGVVWRARDERLDRVVAVKQLLHDAAADELDPELASRLGRREGRVAARLRHPHAIMVHDAVEHDGMPWLVMEYFPAQSLSAALKARGSLPPEFVARVGSQVAAALAAAHADGIVHRDVKPGNVLVAPDGTAKIADFGISRALGDGTMTGSEIFAGTPAYLAPEVAGGEAASFSSDVFSLGATLYTALEGEPPFGLDDNPIALLRRVARGEIIPPRQSGPLSDVVLWMLRPGRGERPTMHEAEDALTAVVEQRPVHPPPQARPPQSTLILPARRPRRRTVAAGAVAIFFVATGIVIGTLITDRPTTVVAANTQPQTAQPPVTTTTADNSACEARYDVTNSWPGGYQATVTVRGGNRPTLTGWAVRWALPAGHTISNLWNGTLAQDGSSVTVTNASWNATVAADSSTTFGFTATTNEPAAGNPARPTLTCHGP